MIRRGAATGFTLIEMIVVLAIIGLLLGFTSIAVLRYRESGRVTEAHARVVALSLLIDSYADRMGVYPPSRLSAVGIDDGNEINEGSEALVAALKSRDYAGRRPEEGWLANGDGDATQATRFADGSRALLELVDPWDNPFVYIEAGQYGKEAVYRMTDDAGEGLVTAEARRDPLTGAWHRYDSYQLVSAGPDGVLGTEDDIANFEIPRDED